MECRDRTLVRMWVQPTHYANSAFIYIYIYIYDKGLESMEHASLVERIAA
jgi:hypothetical protein